MQSTFENCRTHFPGPWFCALAHVRINTHTHAHAHIQPYTHMRIFEVY